MRNQDLSFIPVRALWSSYANYIWLLRAAGDERCVVVDPGEAGPCMSALQEHQLTPAAILITHHHVDHVQGVQAILDRYGDLPVYGPHTSPFGGINRPVKEGDTVDLPAVQGQFAVLETPGHTLDHISFYGGDALIAGDALFTAGCGRLFEGSMEQLYRSVKRLGELPGDTRVYCAHEYTVENLEFAAQVEPRNQTILERLEAARKNDREGTPNVPSTIAMERQSNPFLRPHVAEVKAYCEQHSSTNLHSELDVFGIIRARRG